eukprot:35531_1
MGNHPSENQDYQRMTRGAQRAPRPQYQRSQSVPTPKQQQVAMESALSTLQSMFMMDREVLRLVLVEQCQGNLDTAVETLLAMQVSSSSGSKQDGTQVANTSAPKSNPNAPKSNPNETVLYDNNMRPIIISDSFLQPPSYLLWKEYNLNTSQIERLLNTGNAVTKGASAIYIDPTIIAQWRQLMKKYKFKDVASMDALCSNSECKSLNRCGSLIRVIFMMKLYHRLCNELGQQMNAQSAELMFEYLSRGFQEYSLIQLINDCNHLTQYHQLGGDQIKCISDHKKRDKLVNEMVSYFGFCDVMHCRIIQRILQRQDNNDNKDKKSDIDVERDIVDKYHRVFYHPLN